MGPGLLLQEGSDDRTSVGPSPLCRKVHHAHTVASMWPVEWHFGGGAGHSGALDILAEGLVSKRFTRFLGVCPAWLGKFESLRRNHDLACFWLDFGSSIRRGLYVACDSVPRPHGAGRSRGMPRVSGGFRRSRLQGAVPCWDASLVGPDRTGRRDSAGRPRRSDAQPGASCVEETSGATFRPRTNHAATSPFPFTVIVPLDSRSNASFRGTSSGRRPRR